MPLADTWATIPRLWLGWSAISLTFLYEPVGLATEPRIAQSDDGSIRVEHGVPGQPLFEVYAKKYPTGWEKWEKSFREGFADSSRVLVRYHAVD